MLEDIIEPLEKEWHRKGWGFIIYPARPPSSILVFADNIWILGHTVVQAWFMWLELTHALHCRKLRWKDSSLVYMAGANNTPGDFEVRTGDPLAPLVVLGNRPTHPASVYEDSTRPRLQSDGYEIVPVKCLHDTLGTHVSQNGSTRVQVEHRLHLAEQQWMQYKSLLTCAHAPIPQKIRAWKSNITAVVLHGAAAWHLNQEIGQRLHRWEWNKLRQVFRYRFVPSKETREDFNRRTSRAIEKWFIYIGATTLVQDACLAVFDEAWRDGRALFRQFGQENPPVACAALGVAPGK